MAQIFIDPTSTSSEIASGQYSGHLDAFLVHSVPKRKVECLKNDLIYGKISSFLDTENILEARNGSNLYKSYIYK